MGRKKKTTETTEAQAPETLAADGTPSDESVTETEQKPRERFRSWVKINTAGYERWSDELKRLIVLQFATKPDEEILKRLKASGFRYQAEYFGKEKVWTRRHDFEGRVLAEQLEADLRAKSAAIEQQR